MRKKDIILMVGAAAAAFQAVSSKTSNPNISLLFTFLGVGLAFFASAPRDPESKQRVDDKE